MDSSQDPRDTTNAHPDDNSTPVSGGSQSKPPEDASKRPSPKRGSTSTSVREAIKQNPDPHSHPTLADLRLRQWRRPSRNPFEPVTEKNSTDDNSSPDTQPTPGDGSTAIATGTASRIIGTGVVTEEPQIRSSRRMDSSYSGRTQSSAGKKFPQDSDAELPKPKDSEPEHPPLKHPGSKWVHLFYDLAWSASFASLTESGDFEKPLDTANYFLFFAAVFWLWSSQTLYSIHFYTNDWFHLTSTFLQLFVFGMLSATTLGYDVTNYIAHSPGLDVLRTSDQDSDSDPQQYADEKTAYLSMVVLAVAFAATRLIQLIQYLRVLYYANWSVKEVRTDQSGTGKEEPPRPWIKRIPPQITAITIGFLLSNPMFLAALGITASSFGQTVLGASLKLGLWVLGFSTEVFSHLIMPFCWWIERLRKNSAKNTPKSKDHESGDILAPQLRYSETEEIPPERILPLAWEMNLYERTQTITTIILGEGINGIAGTLAAVLLAPGVGRTVGINVVSTACIVWFIAYIYFEGPKGERAPPMMSLRYMIWLLLHLPLLSSIVLLLIGIKSQFLLTSFLSALFRTINGFNKIRSEQLLGNSNLTFWRTNVDMKHFLIERGIVWEDEFNNFTAILRNTSQAEQRFVFPVWSQRLSLTMVLNTFKDINGGDEAISSDIQPMIDAYYDNDTLVIEDLGNQGNPGEMVYYQILDELLHGFILSTRYIVAFAGLILISLSLQDFVHSTPRDKYQWWVISLRFLMGVILCMLLLLNLGKYQTLFVPPEDLSQRAGVFLWLETFWVLPTMAIGYGVQFLIELFLAWRAKVVTIAMKKQAEEKKNNEDKRKGEEEKEGVE